MKGAGFCIARPWFCVPDSLVVEEFLPGKLKRHADAAHWFISTVAVLQGRKKDKTAFVGVSSKIARQFMGKHTACAIIDSLCGPDGPIERRKHYRRSRPGKPGLCRRYRLRHGVERLLNRRCYDNRQVRRMANNSLTVLSAAAHPAQLHLRNWLNSLRIQEPSAVRCIKAHVRLSKASAIHENIVLNFNRRCASNEFCDDRRGRIYTPLTNLPKHLRHHVRCNGEPLAAVDVVNSQPALVVVAMVLASHRPDVLRMRPGRRRKNPYPRAMPIHKPSAQSTTWLNCEDGEDGDASVTHDALQKRYASMENTTPHDAASCGTTRRDHVMTLAWHQENGLEPEDFQRYRTVCEAGELYEAMMTNSMLAGWTRSEVKTLVMRILFDRPLNDRQSPEQQTLARAFAAEFPSVATFMASVKRRSYKDLAHLLTRLEATIIIGGVVEHLRVNRPDVPIFTVHDALFTTKPHVSLIEGLTRTAFQQFGLTPKLKPEDFAAVA